MESLEMFSGRSFKAVFLLAIVVVTVCAMSIVSFAAAGDGATVTTEMLEPVLEGVKDNVAVIVPVGIGLFVIMLGIAIIPKVFNKFKSGV